MNKIRMLRAINLLRSIPQDFDNPRFDMGAWGTANASGLLELKEADLRQGCGTAACALGWTASTEEARAEGLRLVWDQSQGGDSYAVEYLPPGGAESVTGTDAAWQYFEFEFEETGELLFLPNRYGRPRTVTAAMVANRMQTILDIGETGFLEANG